MKNSEKFENREKAIAQLDSFGVTYTSKSRSIELGLVINSFHASGNSIITTIDVPTFEFDGCNPVIIDSVKKIYNF